MFVRGRNHESNTLNFKGERATHTVVWPSARVQLRIKVDRAITHINLAKSTASALTQLTYIFILSYVTASDREVFYDL